MDATSAAPSPLIPAVREERCPEPRPARTAETLGVLGLPAPVARAGRGRWDAIVVGAGHNGLACAAYLARAGRRVLVLEARRAGRRGLHARGGLAGVPGLALRLPRSGCCTRW